MKTPDQYFDSKVYPSGVVVQSIVSGLFYSTDGQFSKHRPECAQLMPPVDVAALRAIADNATNIKEVKIATVLDYLAATANAIGKPSVWMNAYNGVDARIAHFVLLSEPEVRATVRVVNEYDFMPAFSVVINRRESYGETTLLDSVEPALAHAICQLLHWRDPANISEALAANKAKLGSIQGVDLSRSSV